MARTRIWNSNSWKKSSHLKNKFTKCNATKLPREHGKVYTRQEQRAKKKKTDVLNPSYRPHVKPLPKHDACHILSTSGFSTPPIAAIATGAPKREAAKRESKRCLLVPQSRPGEGEARGGRRPLLIDSGSRRLRGEGEKGDSLSLSLSLFFFIFRFRNREEGVCLGVVVEQGAAERDA